ncbi:MAG: ADP-ribosylglycohydrolase family protein [Desulfobacterales bacterium]|nr:MAG: ADP-ribosylglycohydrolase family protein [Desulfobacterales bacterium]
MTDKAKAMVLTSFAADALALGVHWIYNTNVIDKKWGRVENYIKPERPTYHPTKDLGEFTHYGDQTLVLLKAIAESSGFDLNNFAASWQQFFKSYDGYFDGATKATLENFKAGKEPTQAGSNSDEFAGAARMAPLAYYYRNDLEGLINSAKAQTALTHNNQEVIDSAAFLGEVVFRVLHEEKPVAAIKKTLFEGYDRLPYSKWVEEGIKSIEKDTRQAMLDFGQMCEIAAAFPCMIHLIAKYEDNLREGLIEIAMAGGDSAGRGLAVGMVLGAHLGVDAIPSKWLSELKAYGQITALMDQIDQKISDRR